MLIKKIELVNYGAYGGRNTIELASTGEKPIILIGGTNGAGKTTLFESVMLCLYGIASLDGHRTKKDYEAYLAKRVHREDGMASREGASVSVTFQIARAGKVEEYVVSRSWGMRGESESLAIRIASDKGMMSAGMDESSWQTFIDGLIPRGVAKMFFFDGERIVRMIEDGESTIIKSSFDILLGLDIVNKLRRDLDVNMMRAMRGDNAHVKDEFERLTREKEEVNEQIRVLTERRAAKVAELDSTRRIAAETDGTISSLGGGFTSKRAEIKIKHENAIKSRDLISTRLKETCAGSLPFALISEETAKVEAQIREDRKAAAQTHGAVAIKEAVKKVETLLNSDDVWRGIADQSTVRAKLIPRVITALESVKGGDSDLGMFNFSHEQEEAILSTIHDANGAASKIFSQEAKELTKIEEEIQSTELALVSMPDDDEIGPYITKLKIVQKEIGMIEFEIKHIDEEISSRRALSSHVQVKIRGVLAKIYKDENSDTKVKLTKAIQLALEDYAQNLIEKKICILESNLQQSLSVLMHKKELIDYVKLDKKTYEITLYKNRDVVVPKDTLSKGEQQMFTTAVLWALARTSDRPLPFMIDTPLARLDVEHRDNLLEKFFPIASHQMIIFATDAEIGTPHYKTLYQYISKVYALEHNDAKGQTRICEKCLEVT